MPGKISKILIMPNLGIVTNNKGDVISTLSITQFLAMDVEKEVKRKRYYPHYPKQVVWRNHTVTDPEL